VISDGRRREKGETLSMKSKDISFHHGPSTDQKRASKDFGGRLSGEKRGSEE